MSLYHLTFSSDGRLPFLPSSQHRLAALHLLARVCGARLVLFCVVDDHLHVVLFLPDGAGKRVGRDLLFALRTLSSAPVGSPHVRPVKTRAHADWLVRYLLTQVEHHGLAAVGATWEGSCFWDLAGLRAVPGLGLDIVEALPRWSIERVCDCVGVPADAVLPVEIERVAVLGPGRLIDAVCRAAAVPDLVGRDAARIRAKAALARLSRAAGIPAGSIATTLGIPVRTARGFGRLGCEDALCWAVLGQLALHEHLDRSGTTAARPGIELGPPLRRRAG